MVEVTLVKSWKNHPPGTVLRVSDGVLDDLKALGVLDEKPDPGTKSVKAPSRNKMVAGPSKQK